jgi:hypothetical protein
MNLAGDGAIDLEARRYEDEIDTSSQPVVKGIAERTPKVRAS